MGDRRSDVADSSHNDGRGPGIPPGGRRRCRAEQRSRALGRVAIGVRGAIRVDRLMRTNVPDGLAAGDCVDQHDAARLLDADRRVLKHLDDLLPGCSHQQSRYYYQHSDR